MDGVVASVPLGLIVLAALLLFGAGVVAGWATAHARARRRSLSRPTESTQHVTRLLDALPQAALIVDADGRVIAHNAHAEQLLRALGDAGDLPIAVDAAAGRVIRSHSAEALEVALSGSPTRRWWVTVSPIDDGPASTTALVMFTDPETSSGRADVYQRLISTIAHEVRTPLTAILGHVDILGSCRPDEEPLWRRSLGFVASETERLARLVEDLLSLSRLDRLPLHLQPVSLRVVAEEALSALYDVAERRQVSLVLQSPAELPRVQADPDRIRQVFLNLLDNAVKYAPGSIVTVRLNVGDDRVRVEVNDNGPGVSSEDLPHIFDPLYRGSHMTPDASGTGLGLTIVRTILDQHNAPISVHSVPGQGTTFTFSLPMRRSG
jgi:signal transduction histidine kinase